MITTRRLLLQITPPTSEKHQCSNCKTFTDVPLQLHGKPLSTPEVDPFGDHQIRCNTKSQGLRARLWHDPICRMLQRIGKAANIPTNYEPGACMVNSNLRPDVVFFPDSPNGHSIIVDARTNDPTLADICSNVPIPLGRQMTQALLPKTPSGLPRPRPRMTSSSPSALKQAAASALLPMTSCEPSPLRLVTHPLIALPSSPGHSNASTAPHREE